MVYAVNCGGEGHVDSFGVKYAKDTNRAGTASDYGKQLFIARSPEADQVIETVRQSKTESIIYLFNRFCTKLSVITLLPLGTTYL